MNSKKMNTDVILIPNENLEIIKESDAPRILQNIRAEWQSRSLIQRVQKLLPVDPSSACQRLFNASMHDLKEKIVILGIDIASKVAEDNNLPAIKTDEDIIDNYNVKHIIDLSYNIGLLTRPEWRKICRVYDIRKDLEHEDDEYEAGVEDVVYIFKTTIDIILSKDPIHLVRLNDIMDIIQKPEKIGPLDPSIINDYEKAPENRQQEIYNFLVFKAINPEEPELIRNNCYNALKYLRNSTKIKVILNASKKFNTKFSRSLNYEQMRVAKASGIIAYLSKLQNETFYLQYFELMEKVSYHWTNYSEHGPLLRQFKEIGALSNNIPKKPLIKIVKWLILLYLGEIGGYGPYGRNRDVFYSDIGASLAYEILNNSSNKVNKELILEIQENSDDINELIKNKHIKRRFDNIIDLFM